MSASYHKQNTHGSRALRALLPMLGLWLVPSVSSGGASSAREMTPPRPSSTRTPTARSCSAAPGVQASSTRSIPTGRPERAALNSVWICCLRNPSSTGPWLSRHQATLFENGASQAPPETSTKYLYVFKEKTFFANLAVEFLVWLT